MSKGRSTPIVVDRGDSENVVSDERYMNDMVDIERLTVELANNATVTAHRCRYVKIEMRVKTPRLCKAFVIPEINSNILLCSLLDDRGISTIFARGWLVLRDRDEKMPYLKSSNEEWATDYIPRLFCHQKILSTEPTKHWIERMWKAQQKKTWTCMRLRTGA